jgi:hypothetical protein
MGLALDGASFCVSDGAIPHRRQTAAMNSAPLPFLRPYPSVRRTLPPWLSTGIAVAMLDLAVASLYWALYDLSPLQVLQSIASWVLGAQAFAGGPATAFGGALLYTGLMCALAALYLGISRRFPVLGRKPLLCGASYGAAMYVAVFELLVPHFTAAPVVSAPWHWTVVCVLAYIIVIGIPCGLMARRASR